MGEGRGAERQHDEIGLRCVPHLGTGRQAAAGVHTVEDLLHACLIERLPTLGDRPHSRRVDVDSGRRKPAVDEADGSGRPTRQRPTTARCWTLASRLR